LIKSESKPRLEVVENKALFSSLFIPKTAV